MGSGDLQQNLHQEKQKEEGELVRECLRTWGTDCREYQILLQSMNGIK